MPTYMSHSYWNGTLQDGSGKASVGSGAFESGVAATPQEGQATNPEEIVGAALASCYSLILAKILGEANVTPEAIETTAAVAVDKDGPAPTIAKIGLDVDVEAEELDQEWLDTLAERAESLCPVAKALKGTEISVEARLKHTQA